MEFNDLIISRESIRSYDPDRKVPVETIKKILDAGRVAPSACNYQPWRFLIISSEEMLEKVRECYNREWFRSAPHILIAIGLKSEAWVRSYDGYCSVETDVAIAMTHILLAAENEGIGACWVAAFDPLRITRVLDLGNDQTVYALTPLGYIREGHNRNRIKKRKSLEEMSVFI